MEGNNNCDILYFVPEDNERLNPSNSNDPVQTHFNVFTIPNMTVDQVTLQDIKAWFPIPGDYHFRF